MLGSFSELSKRGLMNGLIIKKYFTPDETRNMITAIFYSKLYYGAEVWHFKGLARTLHKELKYASANALRINLCTNLEFVRSQRKKSLRKIS